MRTKKIVRAALDGSGLASLKIPQVVALKAGLSKVFHITIIIDLFSTLITFL